MHTLNITLRRKRVIKSQAREVHDLVHRLEEVLIQYNYNVSIARSVSNSVCILYDARIENKFDIKTSKGLLKVHLYDSETLV